MCIVAPNQNRCYTYWSKSLTGIGRKTKINLSCFLCDGFITKHLLMYVYTLYKGKKNIVKANLKTVKDNKKQRESYPIALIA